MESEPNDQPVAMTGVAAPSLNVVLRELSALVGWEVVDVARTKKFRHPTRPGIHQPLGWSLHSTGGGRTLSVESHDLRRAERLNEVATTHWHRSPELRRLTGEDGRRLIRLLHEALEAKARMNPNMEDAR